MRTFQIRALGLTFLDLVVSSISRLVAPWHCVGGSI